MPIQTLAVPRFSSRHSLEARKTKYRSKWSSWFSCYETKSSRKRCKDNRRCMETWREFWNSCSAKIVPIDLNTSRTAFVATSKKWNASYANKEVYKDARRTGGNLLGSLKTKPTSPIEPNVSPMTSTRMSSPRTNVSKNGNRRKNPSRSPILRPQNNESPRRTEKSSKEKSSKTMTTGSSLKTRNRTDTRFPNQRLWRCPK